VAASAINISGVAAAARSGASKAKSSTAKKKEIICYSNQRNGVAAAAISASVKRNSGDQTNESSNISRSCARSAHLRVTRNALASRKHGVIMA